MLVDKDLNNIVISQEVVHRIYPERTGVEENRVTYDGDGNIVQDRRNVTYTAAETFCVRFRYAEKRRIGSIRDTIIQKVSPGDRSHTFLGIQFTGDDTTADFWSPLVSFSLVHQRLHTYVHPLVRPLVRLLVHALVLTNRQANRFSLMESPTKVPSPILCSLLNRWELVAN